MANIFAPEKAIIERLTDGLELKTVKSMSFLVGYEETSKLTPAAFIAPGPSTGLGDPDDGGFQQENQKWYVVLAVAHVSDSADDDTTSERAGEYIAEIIKNLVGWKPAKGFKPLRYAGREETSYLPGHAEFPIVFETGLLLTGAD